ncbi:MAG: hypothetical protein AB7P18_23390 [Candidatus Binatia bacterium]
MGAVCGADQQPVDSPSSESYLNGKATSPVELLPIPVFFVTGQRGQSSESAIEIVNHEAQPLRVTAVEHASDRFTTTLETLTAGRRYQLRLRLKPNGPGGKKTEPIVVKTSSPALPSFTIPAYTHLRERVYTVPDEIHMGAVPLADLQRHPQLLQQLTQTLVIYQVGGTDFRATASSELPMLQLEVKPGKIKNRYDVTVSLREEKLQPGPVRGTIFIETNDPQFPQLTVPVLGYFSAGPQ